MIPSSTKPEGAVRKEIYQYLQDQGFDLTDERHDQLKRYLIEYARVNNERVVHELNNARNAMGNMRIAPNSQTIIKRVDLFQCPVCGMDMKKRNEYEYVTQCGHLSDVMLALA